VTTPAFRDVGDSMLVAALGPTVDTGVNRQAWALAQAIEAHAVDGVRGVRATFTSVAIDFDPLRLDRDRLAAHVRAIGDERLPQPEQQLVEIPVAYGGELGPDLEEVAARSALTPNDVIRLHEEAEYHAYLIGFMPGFAYLGPLNPRIVAARRWSPRTRVPAGSVGVAGQHTGVYPQHAPGGWALVGRTALRLFDPDAPRPCLIQPGDRVRFRRVDAVPPTPGARVELPLASPGEASMTVIQPGLLTSVQDEGRFGFEASGVSPGGAMDRRALRNANRLVGNPAGAAALEVTLAGLDVRFDRETVAAVTGADLGAELDGLPVPIGTAVRVRSGSRLRFTGRRTGCRAYVALRGGVDVPRVMGSCSTDLGSGFGGYRGRALRPGDVLSFGSAGAVTDVAGTERSEGDRVPAVARGGPTVLRVLPGPHLDWFADDVLATLVRSPYQVAPQSNRVGYRLTGLRLPRRDLGEMISEATVVGAVQVPLDGQPILLMSDRQVTGGYPLVAVVISADVGRAAQVAPGDEIRFDVCTRTEALRALAKAERPR
jgi:KipI family sensor histidine kinase inhibitor